VSRVHCSACGTAVVVDPSGLCPDGHHVGAAGARVAASMGSATPHADEPEPWVALVVLDDDPATPAAAPRRARPVAVPGLETTDDADQESLLQELHALAEFDLDGFGGDTAPTGREPAPSARAAPTAPAATPVQQAPTPDHAPAADHTPTPNHVPAADPTPTPAATASPAPGEDPTRPATAGTAADAPAAPAPARGGELAALEAALHELSLPEEPASAPGTGAGTDPTASLDGLAGLAELDQLFGSSPSEASAPSPHAPPAPAAPATPMPPPVAAPVTPADPTPVPPPVTRQDSPPTPARAPEPADVPAPPASADVTRAPSPDPAAAPPTPTPPTPAPAANLDIGNFTAKGGKVGGRKRRFGR
jgi:hypothetical protein